MNWLSKNKNLLMGLAIVAVIICNVIGVGDKIAEGLLWVQATLDSLAEILTTGVVGSAVLWLIKKKTGIALTREQTKQAHQELEQYLSYLIELTKPKRKKALKRKMMRLLRDDFMGSLPGKIKPIVEEILKDIRAEAETMVKNDRGLITNAAKEDRE